MGAAKTSTLVLVLLGYGVFVGGVILSNLPVEALLDDPPILELGVSTVVAAIVMALVEFFVP